MNPGKLAWRCRRGLKELDLPLTSYLNEQYNIASSEERERFHRLIEEPDVILWRYLYQGLQPVDPRLESIIRKIRP